MSNRSDTWHEVKFGDVLRLRRQRAVGTEQLLSVTQDRGVVRQKDVGRRDSSSDDKSAYWRVYPGDIVYNTMRMWQGVVGYSKLYGIVSPAYTVCQPHESIDPRFMTYLLKHPTIVAESYRLSQGLVSDTWNLRYSAFSTIEARIPELDEQERIAKIIDTIDDQIRAAIHSIAKIDELRTASIRESTLQGLKCFHNMEASELHAGARRSIGSWSLVPLGSLLSGIDAGHSPDLEDTPAGPGQWGVLKVSAVGNGVFRPGENKVVDDRALCNSAIRVRPGDLLITRANTTQLVGLSCIVEDTPPHLMLCDKTLRLRVAHPYATARYVHIVLGVDEVRRQIEIEATGTSGSMKNISQQAIRRLMIPLGSAEDIERVTSVDALFRAQLDSMRHELERLQALRQGLMDDLLTGRVRVTDGGMERVGTG